MEREVRLDRAYISSGMRWRAQEIATEELGPRHEHDIRRALGKELTQDRFTSLDRELARRIDGGRVRVGQLGSEGAVNDSLLLGRLEHLETVRLAERVSRTEWALAPAWEQSLREWGARGDIIKQIHAAVSGDPAQYHVLRSGQPVEPNRSAGDNVVTGRVADKGLSDELRATCYAVIETPTGHAYHVPLDRRSTETLRVGDWVSFTTKPEAAVRPVDRHIAESARARQDVYELEPSAGDAATIERTQRRLQQLERLGVVTAVAPNRWAVPTNLIELIEHRAGSSPPRHRVVWRYEPLSLEAQVKYPGPVWLDQVDSQSLAPHGLGVEVRRAVHDRRAALRQLGMPEDPSRRLSSLRELERHSVGQELAASSGRAFVPSAPDGMRGTVQIHMARTGTPYAIVSDGTRLAVVPATGALRGLEGKTARISGYPDGRTVVRASPDRDVGR